MKTLVYLLMAIYCLPVFGQISEDAVPEIVMKNFKKRNAQASEIVWDIQGDNFSVKYFLRDKENLALLSPKGELLWMITFIDPKEIMPAIKDYLNSNYNDFRVKSVELYQEDKEKYYHVFVYPKKLKKEEAPVTQVVFSTLGKFIKDIKPLGAGDEQEISTKIPPAGFTPVSEKSLPEAVAAEFKRTFSKSIEVNWYKKDFIFKVKFIKDGKKVTADYDRMGPLLLSRITLSEGDLHPSIKKYLYENYKNSLVRSGEMVEKGKEKYVRVFIYDIKSKEAKPPLTEIQFTPIGKFITKFEPDQIENEPEEVIYSKDEKFAKKVEKETDDLMDNKDQKVKQKELPSPAIDYIAANFDYNWRWEIISLKTTEEFGQIYYVVMKKGGQKERIEHFFDLYGKLLKSNSIQ